MELRISRSSSCAHQSEQSGFYPVQQAVTKGHRLPSIFSTTDEAYHAKLRRCVNNAFSMSALVQYEPFVDTTTEVFLDQTDRIFASQNQICDFAQWLQFFAFDVIGQMTYSKRHGFVDKNEDVDGMVGYLGRLFSYVAPVSLLLTYVPSLLFSLTVYFRSAKSPSSTSSSRRTPSSSS